MSARIDDTLMAVVRQEFLGGESLRKLARRHDVSLRTLADRSKREGWQKQRELHHCATRLPAVASAADRRAERVADNWRQRIDPLLDQMTGIADRTARLLDRCDLSTADFRELATLLKVLTDSISKLADMGGKGGGAGGVVVCVLPSPLKDPAEGFREG